MRKLVTILGLVALTPSLGASFPIEECGRGLLAHHVIETQHQDFSNGVVSYVVASAMDGSAGESLFVVGCKSGETLETYLYRDIYDESKEHWNGVKEYDFRDQAKAKLLELVNANEPYKLSDLGFHMGLPEENWNVSVSDKEVCACRAEYPQMRNGKERFKMEPMYE